MVHPLKASDRDPFEWWGTVTQRAADEHVAASSIAHRRCAEMERAEKFADDRAAKAERELARLRHALTTTALQHDKQAAQDRVYFPKRAKTHTAIAEALRGVLTPEESVGG